MSLRQSFPPSTPFHDSRYAPNSTPLSHAIETCLIAMRSNLFERLLFRARLYANTPIIQCSPPRTGSTLLWNILRIGYPRKRVLKTHGLNDLPRPMIRFPPIVMSVRNPLDMISSSILRYRTAPSRENVCKQIKEIDERGIWDTLKYKDEANVLILKYEEFSNDFDHAFSRIEAFLRATIRDDRKETIRRTFSLAAVEKKSLALGSFQKFDVEDQIHGNHISEFRGARNYYHQVLEEAEIEIIRSHYRQIFEAFDYDLKCSAIRP